LPTSPSGCNARPISSRFPSSSRSAQSSAASSAARKALKGGGEARSIDIEEPEEPKARRYVVNDTTYEALGEILADNPNGVLAFRDELVSLLKTLDREEHVAARGFFLTGWNGTTGYTFDRILRGRTHIEAACLSLLGSTQPGRLAEYVRRAVTGAAGDDGLIQRFGLLVWPDHNSEWRECDRYPNSEAREAAWKTFDRLDKLDPDAIGAERDQFEPLPFIRFDDQAQGDFADWRSHLERRIRSADMSPALESHLAKYRKLIPALALVNHLADGGAGRIDEREARYWTVFVFSASAIEEVERLREGEAVAVSGPFEAEIWAPPGREPRVNFSLVVGAVISARRPAKKRRSSTASSSAPPTQPAIPEMGFDDDGYAGGDPDDRLF
jgi:hypothetical protein